MKCDNCNSIMRRTEQIELRTTFGKIQLYQYFLCKDCGKIDFKPISSKK
jgi:RNase P subunit RPR2